MTALDAFFATLQTLFAGYSLTEILFLVAVAFISGMARGFSGFGAALIFMPLASSVIEPKLAATLLFLIDIVMALPMLPDGYRQADKREVGLMAIGSLVGVPLGTLVLTLADPLTLRWSITVLVVLLLALLLSGWRYHGKPQPLLTIGVGAVAGLFSGAAQIGGPPVIAYWLGGAIPVAFVRANIVLYFALNSIISGVNYSVAGLFTRPAFLLALLVGPAYGIGLVLGSRVFGKADEKLFRRICYGLIAIAAIVGLPLLDPLLR